MSGYRRPGLGDFGAQFGLGPAVTVLLAVNIGIFLLQNLFSTGSFSMLGVYYTGLAVGEGQIWRFFTYMFLHGSFSHLFFNMLGLWLFGSKIEAIWGTRTFTWYYLISGLGGSILYGILDLTGVGSHAPMLGASGAIYGILLAYGLTFPDAVLYVFFVIPMRAKYMVILFGAMSLVGFRGTGDGVAHAAHLGGMVTGFLFLWIFTGGHLSKPPRLPGGGRRGPSGYGRAPSFSDRLRNSFHRWRTRMRLTVVDSKGKGSSKGGGKPGNGSGTTRRDATRVDEILEKISKEGLQSLTPEEQDILRQASRKN